MTKLAFEKIKEGLEFAIRFAGGNETGSVVHVTSAIDVRAIRRRRGLSQHDFALRYRIPLEHLRGWEQGRSLPDGAMRAYLTVIDREHEAVERALSR